MSIDSGAAALAFILQLVGLPADAAEILHKSGKPSLDEADLLRTARQYPVKARIVATTLERLKSTPMPALARMKGGTWLVIGGIGDGKILIQDPGAATPEALSLETFGERWDGRVLLISRRATLSDPYRRFGIGWFVSAIKKPPVPVASLSIALCVFADFTA